MTFVPGKTLVHVSGQVTGDAEKRAMIEVAEELRITAGARHQRFERELTEWFGVTATRLTNSGSSANLLAVASLFSPALTPFQLRPGDEVITVACGFPTTIAPIVQHGAVPVFVDVKAPNYNVDVEQLREAWTPKTQAVVLAHTLGAPFDVREVVDFCRQHRLWLIEDNCDAAGSLVKGQPTGTFGHLSTLSFYPAHHITCGEGGAVLIPDSSNAGGLAKIVTSIRDWGRDCWCLPGCDNTCGARFEQKHGMLPEGFDHKYTYSHLGYNLKMTETQAAIGRVQLTRLADFIAIRRANWIHYRQAFADLQDEVILPEIPVDTEPSWFGFLITMRNPRRRNVIVRALEAARIQTRMLFAGNILRHPAATQIPKLRVRKEYVSTRLGALALPVTDQAMNSAFWIGVYPGITTDMRDYVVDVLRKAVRS